MVSLSAVLTHLFPGITFVGPSTPNADCALSMDGAGEQIAAWNRPESQPTQEQIDAARPLVEQQALIAAYTQALTDHLDATAKQRRYDSRITCMVRAGFPGPYQAEAAAFATWADGCNAQGYQLLQDVLAGRRTLPTIEQMLAELPPMVWPA